MPTVKEISRLNQGQTHVNLMLNRKLRVPMTFTVIFSELTTANIY